MNFNSWQFLLFLPVVVLVYWVLPAKWRWVWLLLASYFFYMCWNVWLVFLILGVTLISYFAGIALDQVKKPAGRKAILVVTIVLCLGILVFFKYFNFLLANLLALLRLFSFEIQDYALDLILPVGVSFYTFQTLSYVVDVYRGRFTPESHFGYYALYVSFFPQLVAGPIERPGDLLPQLKAVHIFSGEDFSEGLRIMISGFFRKCVVADFCGIYVNKVFADLANANSLSIFLAGALFCFEMYCDFAGYSEIAMGSARLMGIKLSVNFDRPYLSTSYGEFFRRWHITLNRWFTDYLYIPLGGNRKGMFRKIFNILVVFTLCGLWHGAKWTYVLWGLYAAFFVILESLLKKPFLAFCSKKKIDLENPGVKAFRRGYMFLIFVPAALIFRAASLSDLSVVAVRLFSNWGFGENYLNDTMAQMGLTNSSALELIITLVAMAGIYYFAYPPKSSLENCPFSEPKNMLIEQGKWAENLSSYIYAILALAFVGPFCCRISNLALLLIFSFRRENGCSYV